MSICNTHNSLALVFFLVFAHECVTILKVKFILHQTKSKRENPYKCNANVNKYIGDEFRTIEWRVFAFMSVCVWESIEHHRCNDDAKLLDNTKLESEVLLGAYAVEMKRNLACKRRWRKAEKKLNHTTKCVASYDNCTYPNALSLSLPSFCSLIFANFFPQLFLCTSFHCPLLSPLANRTHTQNVFLFCLHTMSSVASYVHRTFNKTASSSVNC